MEIKKSHCNLKVGNIKEDKEYSKIFCYGWISRKILELDNGVLSKVNYLENLHKKIPVYLQSLSQHIKSSIVERVSLEDFNR